MKNRLVLRRIKGRLYVCEDIGCDNFERAALNREIIKERKFITGYLEIETAVAKTPLNQLLPKWITLGQLPSVGGRGLEEFGGGFITDINNISGV